MTNLSLLLDIISPYRPRRIPDTLHSVPKPVVGDSVPVEATDSLSSVDVSDVGMQLSDIAPIPSGPMGFFGDGLSGILWTVVVVIAALMLCFYFIKIYRRRA